MIFTDDDLNRFRDIIEYPHHDEVLNDAHTIMELAPALLVRLEAAEALCAVAEYKHPEWETVIDWRKAAGK